MALPQQLKSARLSDASVGSTIDDELGNLEKALADILGIPINTAITAALFAVVAGGLNKIILADLAGDPAAAGELARNAAALKFHDGTAARELVKSNRAINNGTGITGGGDLSADRTLAVAANTTQQKIQLLKNGSGVGTRQALNLVEGAGVTLTITDDAGNDRVNATIASGAGSTVVLLDGGVNKVTRTTAVTFTDVNISGDTVGGDVAKFAILLVQLKASTNGGSGDGMDTTANFRKDGSSATGSLPRVRSNVNAQIGDVTSYNSAAITVECVNQIFEYNLTKTGNASAELIIDLVGYIK